MIKLKYEDEVKNKMIINFAKDKLNLLDRLKNANQITLKNTLSSFSK